MHSLKRLLVISTENHYSRAVAMGIDNYCHRHRSGEYFLCRGNSPEMVKQAELVIRRWQVKGIIAHIQRDWVEQFVRRSGLPAVNVASRHDLDMPSVHCDNFRIGRMIARHFLNNGFQNFAFATLIPDVYAHMRYEGFVKELSTAGFDRAVFTDPYSGQGNLDWDDLDWIRNRKKLDRWLLSLPKPVALMCIYDPYAQRVAWACGHLGLRMPDDVALISVGNDEYSCQMSIPRLSSVEINARQVGYEAARLLHKLMRGGKAPAKPMLIPPGRLISRQSSDMIAVADPDVSAAMRYIRAHAYEPINAKDLVREVPVSKRTLERRFVALLGRTPRVEIARLRLERAKSLLENRGLPIKTVVASSGFVSPRAFARFFYRETCLTPTQYRRNCNTNGYARLEETSAQLL